MKEIGFLVLVAVLVNHNARCFPLNEDVLALKAFKLAVYDDPRSVLADWGVPGVDICSWYGVACSAPENRVISLNLSGSSLRGYVVPELGLLDALQELVLANNSFLGRIPAQLGMLKSLVLLDLSMNNITGPIPPEIGGLASVRNIDLHSNQLDGNVPAELFGLTSLVRLFLNDNGLDGPIPGGEGPANSTSLVHGTSIRANGTGYCQLHNLQVANFSFNFFTGNIPLCLNYLPRANFQENCLNTDSVAQRPITQCNPSTQNTNGTDTNLSEHRKKKQPEWLLVLEIFTGAVFAIFLITYIVFAVQRRKKKSLVINPWKKISSLKGNSSVSTDNEILAKALGYSRQELEVACEDFSNIIGSSPDSKVYKGTMKGGPEIAVISLCIPEDQWTSDLELYFKKEVADFARLNHENTAKLLGYCTDSVPFSRMLVFEYAPNGTLYEHLHYGEGCRYSWIRRMKIALGIARGLRYLHNEIHPPFVLSELHSNSVYLTEDFSPKLVDFERWRSVISRSETSSGYFPNGDSYHNFAESQGKRHNDIQENTFAFGVLLLELISGRPSYCETAGSLVDWAKEYLHDPGMAASHLWDPGLRNVTAEQVSVVCSVASLCIETKPSKRPSMQIIAAMLEGGVDISASAAAALFKEPPTRLGWAELVLSS